jgi:phospholipase/carboxylesterase
MVRRPRLDARPSAVEKPAALGLQPLEAGGLHDGYLYVPQSHTRPNPLLLVLHGSGGHAHHGLGILQNLADEAGLILVAPASTDYTWDVVFGRSAPDLITVNKTLGQVFSSYAIDPAHVAIGGFSDGASYALSLGLANGDLFTHIIAFSPGSPLLAEEIDRPRVFVSHGTRDEILSLEACSHRVLEQLERRGLDVLYVEFDGGHRIPPEVARQAVEWFIEAAQSSHEPPPQPLPASQPSREG